MAIASQRPIVGGLGGGSNLAEEVVVLYPGRKEILSYSVVDRWPQPYIKPDPHVRLKTGECPCYDQRVWKVFFVSKML